MMIIIKLIGTGDKYMKLIPVGFEICLIITTSTTMERLILQSDWDEVLKYAYFETSWEMLRFLSFLRSFLVFDWYIWSVFPWIVYLQSYFHFYNSVECGWISNSLNHSILYSSDRAPDYKGLDLISHIFYYFAKSRRTAFWTYWF